MRRIREQEAATKVWQVSNLVGSILRQLPIDNFFQLATINKASAKAVRETIPADNGFFLDLVKSPPGFMEIQEHMNLHHTLDVIPSDHPSWIPFPPPHILNYSSLNISTRGSELLDRPRSIGIEELWIDMKAGKMKLENLAAHIAPNFFRLRLYGDAPFHPDIWKYIKVPTGDLELMIHGNFSIPSNLSCPRTLITYFKTGPAINVTFPPVRHIYLHFDGVYSFPNGCSFPEKWPQLQAIAVINNYEDQEMTAEFIQRLQKIVNAAPNLKILHLSETCKNVLEEIVVSRMVECYTSSWDRKFWKGVQALEKAAGYLSSSESESDASASESESDPSASEDSEYAPESES